MYVDGSVLPKGTGEIGIGIVIELEGEVIFQRPLKLDLCGTAIVSEYLAIKAGMQEMRKLPVEEVTVFSDCLPLVKHLKGEISASKPHLEEYRKEIMDIVSTIDGKVTFSWIPKNLNGLAHALARRSHDTPAVRRKVDGRGRSIDIYKKAAYIEDDNGCYFKVDTSTFRCSCREYSEKGDCKHSQKMKKMENWDPMRYQ